MSKDAFPVPPKDVSVGPINTMDLWTRKVMEFHPLIGWHADLFCFFFFAGICQSMFVCCIAGRLCVWVCIWATFVLRRPFSTLKGFVHEGPTSISLKSAKERLIL